MALRKVNKSKPEALLDEKILEQLLWLARWRFVNWELNINLPDLLQRNMKETCTKRRKGEEVGKRQVRRPR